MNHTLATSIKENRKSQKDFMINEILQKFTHRQKALIAKLMKENYKEGFLNGMKIKH
jgi:hypothetical protein